jgi:hypothetical protein
MRERPNLVEADLRQFFNGTRLGDLWRFDEHGCRLLTYRQIYVCISHLPAASALAIDANGGVQPWSITDHLIADLWVQRANERRKKSQRPKDHPRRPVVKRTRATTPEHNDALRAAQRRAKARRQRLQQQQEGDA